MVSTPPPDLELVTIDGDKHSLEERLTTFHLACVVLDPYTNESAWILKTACRILDGLRGSDARVNLVVTADADAAKSFLGPIAQQFMVFCDPDRTFVRGLGLATLPAFVFVRFDGAVAGVAEGWNPAEWKAVAATIAAITAWTPPTIPTLDDPSPFHGTPALG